MDVATLREVMPGLGAVRAGQLIDGANEALRLADCTTVNRAAMFLAQIGHESVSCKYSTEIASGAAYEGRKDLGNTRPGDGVRFKGRSFIQITGGSNYLAFSRWAHGKGLVRSERYFYAHPVELAGDRWAWIGAVWYWTVARAKLNSYADAGDIHAATRAVNGGLNGITDRIQRWNRARALGTRLLPTTTTATQEDDMDARQDAMLTGLYHQMSGSPKAGEWPGWDSFAGQDKATLLDFLRRTNRDVVELRKQVAEQGKALANILLLLTRADGGGP